MKMIKIVLKCNINNAHCVHNMKIRNNNTGRLYIRGVMFMSVTYTDSVIVIPIVNTFSR